MLRLPTPPPREAYDLYREAQRHLDEQNPRGAVRALEKMAPEDLATPAAQRLLAHALFRFAALGRARAVAEALLDADPHDAEAAYLLGRTLQRQGEHEAARPYLLVAETIAPEQPDA